MAPYDARLVELVAEARQLHKQTVWPSTYRRPPMVRISRYACARRQ